MKKMKMCARCFDKIQSNVVFKFERYRDNKIFHICGLCAEHGFNAEELKEKITGKYTTLATR